MDKVEIPADVVKLFDGKGMAVVGFEVDQVFKTPEGDVSVPINVAYCHHFEFTMIGKDAKVERIELTGPDDLRAPKNMGHHRLEENIAYVYKDMRPDSEGKPPIVQAFGAANGGEYRKSLCIWYAQTIEGLQAVYIIPMQIDTWNRDKMNKTGGSPFVSGPVPRNSLAP